MSVAALARPRAYRYRSRGPAPRFGAGARLFLLSLGMLAAAFLTALLYLRVSTQVSADGYDLHALQSQHDELLRENQLLQLEIERLDAPARIEVAARRLGLQKAARTVFVATWPSLTVR